MGRPGVLQSMGAHSTGHDLANERHERVACSRTCGPETPARGCEARCWVELCRPETPARGCEARCWVELSGLGNWKFER